MLRFTTTSCFSVLRTDDALGDISIYAQESHATTRRLAVMNLALRGIEVDFGPEPTDTFRRDLHPDLRADYGLVAKVRKGVQAWLNKGYAGAPADQRPSSNHAAKRVLHFRARGDGLWSDRICS